MGFQGEFCVSQVSISTFQLIAHFELLKEGGIFKSYTIILSRYGVATVKFIVDSFGVIQSTNNSLI